jgi:hypothetical protein
VAGQVGHPVCHGDKFMIDVLYGSQFDSEIRRNSLGDSYG